MLWEGALQFYIETADHMTSEPRDFNLELVGGALYANLSGKYGGL